MSSFELIVDRWGAGPGRGGDLFELLFLIIVVALVVAVAVALLTRVAARTNRAPGGAPLPPPHDDALTIARARYARGEITREEYVALSDDLSGPRVS
jgi:uncharacterized membrane protein